MIPDKYAVVSYISPFLCLCDRKCYNQTILCFFCPSKTLPNVVLRFIGLLDNFFTPAVLGVLPHITCGIFVTCIKESPHNSTLRPISLANGRRTNKLVAPTIFED